MIAYIVQGIRARFAFINGRAFVKADTSPVVMDLATWTRRHGIHPDWDAR